MPKSRTRKKATRPTPREPWSRSSLGFEVHDRQLGEVLFPADVAGLDSPEVVSIDVALTVHDAAGDLLEELRLDFQRRQRRGAVVEVWGTALGGLLQVHFRGSAAGAWKVRMSVADQDFDAAQAAAVLRFIEVMRPPNGISLHRPGDRGLVERLTRPAASTPPAGLPEATRALARLQQHLGVSIPFPEQFSAALRRDLAAASALIAGQTVIDRWQERQLPVTAALARRIREEHDELGLLLELPEQWAVTVDGVEYLLPVSTTYRQLQVTAWPVDLDLADPEQAVELNVVPGTDDRMELRLRPETEDLPPGELIDVPDPHTEVPAAAFERLLASLEAEAEPIGGLERAAVRLAAARSKRA